jgi:hypothetical protein
MTSKVGLIHVIDDASTFVDSIGTSVGYSSGSAKTKSALPWPAPSIPGRKPSVQAPQPVGTATYCRPSML